VTHSQLPTFVLDGDVLGILSVDAAAHFARQFLSDVAGDDSTFSIEAVCVDDASHHHCSGCEADPDDYREGRRMLGLPEYDGPVTVIEEGDNA